MWATICHECDAHIVSAKPLHRCPYCNAQIGVRDTDSREDDDYESSEY